MKTQNKTQVKPFLKGNDKKKSIMKTIKLNKIVLLIFGLVVFNACVQDDEFDTPNTTITEPVLDLQVITIDNLIAAFEQEFLGYIDDLGLDPNSSFDQEAIAELREDYVISLENTNNYVSGYVISNDEGGNWFEEIILQNTATEATGGIRVMIDVNPLFTRYQFGQLMYVRLPELHMGISNGVITLGVTEELEKIAAPSEEDFLKRSSQIETIVPREVTIEELVEGIENTFIKLNNVQFNRNIALGENNLTFAGEPTDEFDGERTLESCDTSGSIIVSTSTFADFKSLSLPEGQGSISGVFTNNFFGDVNNLVINSPEDIDFGGVENRCDPDFIECTGNTSSANTIFEEDFQSIGDESDLDAMGWTNVNVSGGSERYEDSSFSGNTYMKISAFGTGEDPLEAWLVTPAINLDGSDDEELSFDISANFETGTILEAFITTNYTGDPTTTEWTILDANIPVGDGGFGDFVSSNINISCLDGDVHVAFKYLGAADGAETRYHIDAIKVTGN